MKSCFLICAQMSPCLWPAKVTGFPYVDSRGVLDSRCRFLRRRRLRGAALLAVILRPPTIFFSKRLPLGNRSLRLGGWSLTASARQVFFFDDRLVCRGRILDFRTRGYPGFSFDRGCLSCRYCGARGLIAQIIPAMAIEVGHAYRDRQNGDQEEARFFEQIVNPRSGLD